MRILIIASLMFAAACAITPRKSPTPADELDVIATVQAFFDVIASKDAQAGARLTIPEGVFVNIREEHGRLVVKHFSNAEWLAGLADEPSADTEAFDGEPTVLIEGDVAVLWAPYTLDQDGKRSHTGIDAFNLIRTEGGWKISGGAYSVVH